MVLENIHDHFGLSDLLLSSNNGLDLQIEHVDRKDSDRQPTHDTSETAAN